MLTESEENAIATRIASAACPPEIMEAVGDGRIRTTDANAIVLSLLITSTAATAAGGAWDVPRSQRHELSQLLAKAITGAVQTCIANYRERKGQ